MATRESADPLQRRIGATLGALPPAPRYLVAFSGGRDSVVLLHGLCAIAESLPGPVEAVYVNHGLQHAADEWAQFCQTICNRWQTDGGQVSCWLGFSYPSDVLDGDPGPPNIRLTRPSEDIKSIFVACALTMNAEACKTHIR